MHKSVNVIVLSLESILSMFYMHLKKNVRAKSLKSVNKQVTQHMQVKFGTQITVATQSHALHQWHHLVALVILLWRVGDGIEYRKRAYSGFKPHSC